MEQEQIVGVPIIERFGYTMHRSEVEVTVRAVRRINNNVAVCEDSAGNELLAMGKGIGFGKLPRELSLDEIERTFYDVDERFFSAINDLPQDVMAFSIEMADYVRSELDYQLSPNFAFTLADHLTFAVKRAKDKIRVSMPLAFDVEQNYPDEYRVARHILRRARRRLGAPLPNEEVTAIAINVVNARVEIASEAEQDKEARYSDMLEDVTEIIEDEFGLSIDRGSFAFSRYATHMRYLFDRLESGSALDSSVVDAFRGVEKQYPAEFKCVERIARHIEESWSGAEISDDEKVYLVIHVSRMCIKNAGN